MCHSTLWYLFAIVASFPFYNLQEIYSTGAHNSSRHDVHEELHVMNALRKYFESKEKHLDYEQRLKNSTHDATPEVLVKEGAIPLDKNHLYDELRNLIDLHRAYNLTIRDLINGGSTPDFKKSSLTAEDCIHILQTTVEKYDCGAAVELMEECDPRFDDVLKKEAQKTLILSSLLAGDKQLSRRLVQQYLQISPPSRALSDLAVRLSVQLREWYRLREKDEWRGFNACAGDYNDRLQKFGYLKCRYNHHNSPYLTIAPLKEEMLSLDPKISVFREAIYDSEIELMKADSRDKFHSARVRNRDGVYRPNVQARAGEVTAVDNRHPKYTKLWNRLEDLSSLSMKEGELFQMVRYPAGGFHRVHTDYIGTLKNDTVGLGERGNRVATALMYLNTVPLGGNTVFPRLKLSVRPVKRSILFWMNMIEDKSWDKDTLHAACPVIYGEKLASTEWFREKGQDHWIAEPEDDEKARLHSPNPNILCQIRE